MAGIRPSALAKPVSVRQNGRMTPIDDALQFGGTALAHAAWIASDLQEGELVCPIVIFEEGGDRVLYACEALTQLEAVQIGDRKARELTEGDADRWAFAREGLITDPKSSHKYDVLAVSYWSRGLDEPVKIQQLFIPSSVGTFRLIGEPLVAVHDHVLTEPVQSRLRQFVRAGINSHPQGDMWTEWQSRCAI
jgi:hypothetical protein